MKGKVHGFDSCIDICGWICIYFSLKDISRCLYSVCHSLTKSVVSSSWTLDILVSQKIWEISVKYTDPLPQYRMTRLFTLHVWCITVSITNRWRKAHFVVYNLKPIINCCPTKKIEYRPLPSFSWQANVLKNSQDRQAIALLLCYALESQNGEHNFLRINLKVVWQQISSVKETERVSL